MENTSAKGAAWSSLCNEASDLLVPILLNRMEGPGDCEQAMEKTIGQTESAIYRWYEDSLQQAGTLLAGLSQLEHLRFVWLNFAEDASPPSAGLCRRILGLISQWRYLWYSPSDEGICAEIKRLEDWLHICLITGLSPV